MGAVVLITGASTGFGRNAAERLARRGHHVFATMRDINGRNAEHRDALERLAAHETLPLRVLELDVTDDRSVQEAVQGALREVGHLDAVINNAGVAGIGVTEAYTVEQVQQMFDVNVFSVVRVNRAVLPSMRGGYSTGRVWGHVVESGPFYAPDDPDMSNNVRYILTVRWITTT